MLAPSCDEPNKTIIKKGYVRMKGRFLGRSWKKKILVLYGPSSQGLSRLVKYSNEKAFEEDEPSSEITLSEVGSAMRCKMSEGSHGDGITLKMVDRSIKQFLCDSEQESKDWLNCIQPEIGRNESLPDGMFRVFLLPCVTLSYHGECVVEVNAEYVYLYDNEQKSQLITKCHITHIRRYGADPRRKQFLIEVGNNNPTGEGIYLLRSIYYDKIHKCVNDSSMNFNRGQRTANRRPSDRTGPIYENERVGRRN